MSSIEQALSEHLGNHYYALVWSNLGPQLVDLNDAQPQEAERQPEEWIDAEYRALIEMKRKGMTMDQIEGVMGRDRRIIQNKWSKRAEWMPAYITPRLSDATLDDLARAVCGVYRVGKGDLTSQSKKRHACEARQVLYWLARKYTKRSLAAIGAFCGGRDHSTVLHGYQKVEERLADFKPEIDLCLADLGILGK